MIDIAQHIEYLLLHHDCVVVPGLGAFIVNDESARYVPETHEFMPPSRTIGFNPEVRHNDAMLLGSISRRNGISLSAARMELDNEVASLNHQLELDGEIPLGNLGLLYRGNSAEYPTFEPSDNSLPSRLHDGLPTVRMRPLQEEPVAVSPVQADFRRQAVIPAPLKIVASVIVVMVAFGILYSTTSLVNGPSVNTASLDTGISSRMEQSRLYEPAIDETLSREIELNIAIPAEQVAADAGIAVKADAKTVIGAEAPMRYLLVVGSFPSRSSANRHISYVGDQSLRVIEMDGNFRIYAASARTINEARQLVAELSEAYPDVWICRR